MRRGHAWGRWGLRTAVRSASLAEDACDRTGAHIPFFLRSVPRPLVLRVVFSLGILAAAVASVRDGKKKKKHASKIDWSNRRVAHGKLSKKEAILTRATVERVRKTGQKHGASRVECAQLKTRGKSSKPGRKTTTKPRARCLFFFFLVCFFVGEFILFYFLFFSNSCFYGFVSQKKTNLLGRVGVKSRLLR